MFVDKSAAFFECFQAVKKQVKAFVLMCAVVFAASNCVLAQGNGIADYDLKSSDDMSFAFDFDHSGKADHLVFYRPGSGVFYVVGKVNGNYQTVYRSTNGIGSFDLASSADRLFAIDYDGSGYADHIVAYRPGSGVVYILALTSSGFQEVYSSTKGIADYDLSSSDDVLFAYDLNSTGLTDHIVAYRPGSGIVHILEKQNGSYQDVFQSSSGIGGYDLGSTSDILMPVDFASNGTSDHLLAYRPGSGVAYVLRYQPYQSTFQAVFQSTTGIGAYDLASADDRIATYDLNGTGLLSTLIAYRPGSGTTYVLAPSFLNYNATYESSTGLGGYDMLSSSDKLFAFDGSSSGYLSSLVAYRPGSGVIYVIGRQDGMFQTQFMDQSSAANPAMFRVPGQN